MDPDLSRARSKRDLGAAKARDCDRQGGRAAVAARNAHRLKRERRYFHRLAVDLHFQEMVLLRPGAYIGVLHLALHVASMQLAACAAHDEGDPCRLLVRLTHLEIVFVSIEDHLHAGSGEQPQPVAELLEAGRMLRARL